MFSSVCACARGVTRVGSVADALHVVPLASVRFIPRRRVFLHSRAKAKSFGSVFSNSTATLFSFLNPQYHPPSTLLPLPLSHFPTSSRETRNAAVFAFFFACCAEFRCCRVFVVFAQLLLQLWLSELTSRLCLLLVSVCFALYIPFVSRILSSTACACFSFVEAA